MRKPAISAIGVLAGDGAYLDTLPAPAVSAAFLGDSLFAALRLEEAGESVAARREFRDCAACPLMVELPPGGFLMAAPEGEAPAAADPNRQEWTDEAEKPQLEVTIDYPLAVGQNEVTFNEWDVCVAVGGCSYEPSDNGWGRCSRRVIHIARRDALEYIRWLREVSGPEYRLPSEAEWEYAARGGTTTARYWGDDLPIGTIPRGCGTRWDKRSTAPVGSFPPNPFGLYDMLSNVPEWTADCWFPTHEGNPADGSARVEGSRWYNDGDRERPVMRGGAY